MAELLQGGNAAVQALMYGDVNPGTQRYFESQRNQGFSNLTDTAQNFMSRTVSTFGQMALDSTKRLISNIRRGTEWAWNGDYIRPLRATSDLQFASPTMIRYVMADPNVRKMYHAQQLAGYDGLYEDLQPGVVGEGHMEYRHVMDGIIQADDDHWEAVSYLDDYLEDEQELDFVNQLDIIETWACVNKSIAKRFKDPTSLYNASLD